MIGIQQNPTATIISVWVSNPGHTGASRELYKYPLALPQPQLRQFSWCMRTLECPYKSSYFMGQYGHLSDFCLPFCPYTYVRTCLYELPIIFVLIAIRRPLLQLLLLLVLVARNFKMDKKV